MNIEAVFFDLVSTGWFFLAGWIIILLVASGITFGDDLS